MFQAGSSFGIERDDTTYFVRLLTAEFIKRVTDDNKTEAWYWAFRGNCNFSFNRLLGLTPRSYAAFLLAGDFVCFGRKGIALNRKETGLNEGFLKKEIYGFRGDRNGCAETTKSNVVLKNINPTAKEGSSKLDLIRIGNYNEEGETIVASKAFNDGATPPPLTHSLRTHQRWFNLNLRSIISEHYKNDKLHLRMKLMN